jgi:molybdopterin converting factor small subunit
MDALTSIDAVTISVLLFASYADAAGRGQFDVTVPPGSTVADAVDQLQRALSGAARGIPRAPLVAVNREYAAYERVLHSGDELALIPPVAGG